MARPKISKLKKKLMILIKAHVKRRDNYTCQWCGRADLQGSNCHVSHVIPVSHGNALAFDPMNMKVLCFHCHINKWHKSPIKAFEWFSDKFPERIEYLEKHQHDEVHWKEHDYLQMIEEAKDL